MAISTEHRRRIKVAVLAFALSSLLSLIVTVLFAVTGMYNTMLWPSGDSLWTTVPYLELANLIAITLTAAAALRRRPLSRRDMAIYIAIALAVEEGLLLVLHGSLVLYPVVLHLLLVLIVCVPLIAAAQLPRRKVALRSGIVALIGGIVVFLIVLPLVPFEQRGSAAPGQEAESFKRREAVAEAVSDAFRAEAKGSGIEFSKPQLTVYSSNEASLLGNVQAECPFGQTNSYAEYTLIAPEGTESSFDGDDPALWSAIAKRVEARVASKLPAGMKINQKASSSGRVLFISDSKNPSSAVNTLIGAYVTDSAHPNREGLVGVQISSRSFGCYPLDEVPAPNVDSNGEPLF